jgi:hypothetical protein
MEVTPAPTVRGSIYNLAYWSLDPFSALVKLAGTAHLTLQQSFYMLLHRVPRHFLISLDDRDDI